MKFFFSVFSFFIRNLARPFSAANRQVKESMAAKESTIDLLKSTIEQLQQEIASKNTQILELTSNNSLLEDKVSKILSDISTSIHLN